MSATITIQGLDKLQAGVAAGVGMEPLRYLFGAVVLALLVAAPFSLVVATVLIVGGLVERYAKRGGDD